jgi:3-oxoadipate enol-lactonase
MIMLSRMPDYDVAGNSDVTVYLLHGAYGSKDYWRFQKERLVQRGFRVVAWDAPGYGISTLPPELSLLSIGEAAARLIEKTSTATNVVIGHSMGGQIAPRVCRLIPQKVDALIISATIGFFGNKTKEEQDEFVKQRSGPKLSEDKMAEASRAMVTSMFAPGAVGAEIELVRETAARTPQDTFRAAIQAIKSASDDDAIDAIKGIRAPALCIAGELDSTGNADGMQRLAALIPGAEFAVIPGVGHYGWAEKPTEFNALVFNFLTRKVPAVARLLRTESNSVGVAA